MSDKEVSEGYWIMDVLIQRAGTSADIFHQIFIFSSDGRPPEPIEARDIASTSMVGHAPIMDILPQIRQVDKLPQPDGRVSVNQYGDRLIWWIAPTIGS